MSVLYATGTDSGIFHISLNTHKGRYKLNFTEEKAGVRRRERKADWRAGYAHILTSALLAPKLLPSLSTEMTANANHSWFVPLEKNTW